MSKIPIRRISPEEIDIGVPVITERRFAVVVDFRGGPARWVFATVDGMAFEIEEADWDKGTGVYLDMSEAVGRLWDAHIDAGMPENLEAE